MGAWDRKVLVVNPDGTPVTFGTGASMGTVDQGNRGTQAQAWYTDPSGVTSPVSIANGLNVAQGATTDAEATGNGSIIAILKRLRTIITSPWDSTNNFFKSSLATLIAGEDLPNGIMRTGLKGGGWTAFHNPGVGLKATISQPAGGVGVKNVIVGASFGASTNIAPSATTVLTVNLRDGATGAGTIKQSWTIVVPNSPGLNISIPIPPLWIEGSVNTAMTLEFTALLGNCLQWVNMFGVTLP